MDEAMLKTIICFSIFYNVIVSIVFCDLVGKKGKYEANWFFVLISFFLLFVPIIGCFLVLAIEKYFTTNKCEICEKTVRKGKRICNVCNDLYILNDDEDLRYAKAVYNIKNKAKKKVIDKKIGNLKLIDDEDLSLNGFENVDVSKKMFVQKDDWGKIF